MSPQQTISRPAARPQVWAAESVICNSGGRPRSLRGGWTQSLPHEPALLDPPRRLPPQQYADPLGVEHTPPRQGDDRRRRRDEHALGLGRARHVVLAAGLDAVAERGCPPAVELAGREGAGAVAEGGDRRDLVEGGHALGRGMPLRDRGPAHLPVLVSPPAPDIPVRVEGAGGEVGDGDAPDVGEAGHVDVRLRRRHGLGVALVVRVRHPDPGAGAPAIDLPRIGDDARRVARDRDVDDLRQARHLRRRHVGAATRALGARARRDAELAEVALAGAVDRAAREHDADMGVAAPEAGHVLGERDGEGVRRPLRDVGAPPSNDVVLDDALRAEVGAEDQPSRWAEGGHRERGGGVARASGGARRWSGCVVRVDRGSWPRRRAAGEQRGREREAREGEARCAESVGWSGAARAHVNPAGRRWPARRPPTSSPSGSRRRGTRRGTI